MALHKKLTDEVQSTYIKKTVEDNVKDNERIELLIKEVNSLKNKVSALETEVDILKKEINFKENVKDEFNLL